MQLGNCLKCCKREGAGKGMWDLALDKEMPFLFAFISAPHPYTSLGQSTNCLNRQEILMPYFYGVPSIRTFAKNQKIKFVLLILRTKKINFKKY